MSLRTEGSFLLYSCGIIYPGEIGLYQTLAPCLFVTKHAVNHNRKESTITSSEALLQRVLKSFRSKGLAQVPGYKKFGYIRETGNAVIVSREAGKDTRIPFEKIIDAINAVKVDPKI